MPTSAAYASARNRCIRSILVLSLCSGMLVLAPAPARANVVTFKFAGVVDFVMDQTNLLGGSVVIGTPISGAYTFDSATPDTNPDSRFGSYSGAIKNLNGSLGNLGFLGPSGPNGRIGISLLAAFHAYSAVVDSTLNSQQVSLSLSLSDDGATLFGSDALPLLPPDLQGIESLNISVVAEDIGLNVDGQPLSLVLVPRGVWWG